MSSLPGFALPVMRSMETLAGVMSPLRVKWKLPRIPSFTTERRSSRTTDARVPSDRAMASSTSSAACAASSANMAGCGVPRSLTSSRACGPRPASGAGESTTPRYIPCAARPASSSASRTGWNA